jgi:pyridoxine kinase
MRPRARPGYASFRGERLDGAALLSLVEGLSANGLVEGAYSHLLTGYIGSLSFLRAVASVAATLRAGNPGLVYGAPPAWAARTHSCARAAPHAASAHFPRCGCAPPAPHSARAIHASVCDPVLGDGGKLYVPAELVDAYRAEVVPLASVVTPNQFEAELLTQRPVRTLSDAVRPHARVQCAGAVLLRRRACALRRCVGS